MWPNYTFLFIKQPGYPFSGALTNSILAAGVRGGEQRECGNNFSSLAPPRAKSFIFYSSRIYWWLHNTYKPFIQNILLNKTQECIFPPLNSKGSEDEAKMGKQMWFLSWPYPHGHGNRESLLPSVSSPVEWGSWLTCALRTSVALLLYGVYCLDSSWSFYSKVTPLRIYQFVNV